MRLITLVLAFLLLLVQMPLWLGKGGWLRVHELEGQLTTAQTRTEELKARNAKLESEVRDLKDGTGAVEERARFELGMIKQNEVFIQILGANGQPKASATPLPPPPPPKPAAKP
ncbi:MAG: cell division protein FtsB [Bdellovibrionales bacterium]|nr:cell division protein FtsB [Massilia sp.]